jgi:hypothetical protein
MSATTTNRRYTGEGSDLAFKDIAQSWSGPIAASEVLYTGALAGVLLSDTSTDYPGMKNFVGDGTMAIRGFVTLGADNTGGAKGARPIRVQAMSGTLVDKNAGGGSAIAFPADFLKPIYGADNQTCSKLSTDGVIIGCLVGWDPASSQPVVLVSPVAAAIFQAFEKVETFTQTYSTTTTTVPAATAAQLTDNSGGATADGTIGAVTAPTALTDSTGGTADGTLSAVGATNSGDVSGTINNNFKELTTAQGQNRTAIIALTDAVKELSTEINLLVADSLANRKLINALIDALQAAGIAG